MSRQNWGCNYLTRTSSNRINRGESCSLTESRYSLGSSRHGQRRSNECSRTQNTPRMDSNRQLHYRSPGTNQSRGNKRTVQHQNSDSSLLYGSLSRP